MPTNGSRPAHSGPARKTSARTSAERVTRFRRRVLVDALADGLADTWERRAAMFEWARPRPGDNPGRATAADLDAADRRCAAIAEACRHRAELAREHVLDVADALEEVA